MLKSLRVFAFAAAGPLLAQDPAGAGAKPAEFDKYRVETGTKIPLQLINSVSTKSAAPGDRIYLETAFPVLAGGRIVIPPGSYVAGTVTHVKRPGKVKGKGELHVRFDSLTLPNGVTRDFRARVGGIDGRSREELDREEGLIRSEGTKGKDAKTVGEAAAAGASIGVIAGSVGSNPGLGSGIGAAAGAAAALAGVLLTRGADAMLERGSTLEMVLDRPVSFQDAELDFGTPARRPIAEAAPAKSSESQSRIGRFPF